MEFSSLVCKLFGHNSIKIWEHSFDSGGKNFVSSIYRCERCPHYTVNDKIFVDNDILNGDEIINPDGTGSYEVKSGPIMDIGYLILAQQVIQQIRRSSCPTRAATYHPGTAV